MYLDSQSSLALHKVNLQFFFRICDLARKNALRWSEASNRSLDAGAAEWERAATSMLDAADWSSLAVVSGDLYWKALQLQVQNVQKMAETGLTNQAAFGSALQEAVSNWQQASTAKLKERRGSMPFSATLQDCLQGYLRMFAPQEAAEAGGKGAGTRAH